MNNQFYFKDVDADERLKSLAQVALDKILNRAPFGSRAVGLIERQDDGYRCSIDVYSIKGPFMACAVRSGAGAAILSAQEKLSNQLEIFSGQRGFSERNPVQVFSATS